MNLYTASADSHLYEETRVCTPVFTQLRCIVAEVIQTWKRVQRTSPCRFLQAISVCADLDRRIIQLPCISDYGCEA